MALSFVYKEASRRALELSKRHGDEVSQCLRKEVVRIETTPDGNHEYPRGLQAAIRYVHIANNNGNASENAAEAISGIVDLVAERACGVSTTASQ